MGDKGAQVATHGTWWFVKRILHFISSARLEGGGPIEGVRQNAAILSEYGHKPAIVSLDSPTSVSPAQYPVPLYALGPGKGSYCYTPSARVWLREHLLGCDAMTVHGLWQHHNVLARDAAQKARVPYYIFAHGMLDPYFRRAYPLKHFKKVLYWPWQYLVLRDARAVLFTCEQERLLARKSFKPYCVREKVVRYGTAGPDSDNERAKASFLAKHPGLMGRPFLLFLSRIHPKKGCDILLQAYAEVYRHFQDAPFLAMAGPDQVGWGAELKMLAGRLGIAHRIIWTGMLEGDVKWGAFRACEAFVLPSHQENFGIVVAEAMACSKPVLISQEVNIWREVVEDGAGIAEPDTLEGTVSLLRRWSAMPEARRLAMGEAGARSFANRFEIHAATKSFLEAIED